MSHSVPTIDVRTLQQWLEADEVLLVDVREEHEFRENCIPGAILFPLSQFSALEIPETGQKKIVFQCRSGQRSACACVMYLQEFPQAIAYNLEGGILAWISANTSAQSDR